MHRWCASHVVMVSGLHIKAAHMDTDQRLCTVHLYEETGCMLCALNSWIVFISWNFQKKQQRKQSKTAFFKSNTSVQGHPLWTSWSLLPVTEWFNRWGNNVHQIICQIMELLRYYSLREWQVKRVQLSARQAFYSGGFHMINRHLAISMPTKNT